LPLNGLRILEVSFLKTGQEHPSPISTSQPDYIRELALGNLPRMWWLLLTSTSLSVLMAVLNILVFHRVEFAPWQVLDIGGSAVFLTLFWLAGKGRLPRSWVWPLSPAYFAFWLILMDGYYFAGVKMSGDITAYVLGAMAPAVLIIMPPRVFLLLLIPNHLVFCGLTLFQSSLPHRGGDVVFSALVNGTLGVLIAVLGAWFLYSATRATSERTREVFERKKEAKLAASHLNAILENIPFQAWLKDTKGAFLAVNREFADQTAFSAEEIVGRTAREIYTHERAARYHEQDADIVLTGERVYFEESIEEDQGTRWFEVFKSPVMSDEGACVGTAGLARDITERKEIENRLVAADTAKSEFLATMSHEIRTPMNSVLGYAELLRDTPMSQVQKEYVASINNNGQLLLAIINAILDFSKLEAGKIAIKPEVLSLAELMGRMETMFKPLADQKGLTFRIEIDRAAPAMLLGDICRVEQLLVNLLSNAIKFTESGQVELMVRAERTGEAMPEWGVSFQVKDSGIGITEEEMGRLFKPFSQIDSAMSRMYDGTGLGLVIVERLCRLMTGRISVHSQPGCGSIFTATIQLGDAGAVLNRSGEQPGAEVAEPELSSCKVLVVEDNASNRRLVTTVLKRWQITAMVAEGGAEALCEVKRQHFDLILMDVQMPGMDGLQATKLIREWEASENRSRARIVALTAFAQADDSAKCLEAGMDDYLSKPLNLSALREVVIQAHAMRAAT